MVFEENVGISGSIKDQSHDVQALAFLFFCLSWYNSLELVVLSLLSFRRWRGLYFWSLFLSAVLGVIPYSLGFFLKFFSNVTPYVSVAILTVGWWVMVTGQSLVLFSRLHLVVRDQRTLRRILYMIFTNAVLLHFPTTALTFGSNAPGASPRFITAYNVYEKIQMTGFTIQETIISLLYVRETARILRDASSSSQQHHRPSQHHRRIMHQLIGINIIIIILDLTLLCLEYASQYAIQISFKGAVYSVKLKLEFAVLGRLVDFVRHAHAPSNSMPLGSMRYCQDVDVTGIAGGAGIPAARADDPHFYGNTTTNVDACLPSQQMSSSEERLNLPPDGIIMTKTEFSMNVEDRPPPPDYEGDPGKRS